MPIYAYKCSACGHAKDVLQKISDDPLSVCPACGAEQFLKQVTAAGFQLKGSGWYVSDFRSAGDGANSGVGKERGTEKTSADSTPAKSDSAASTTGTSAPAPATSPAPAPAAANAPDASTATKSVAAPAGSTA